MPLSPSAVMGSTPGGGGGGGGEARNGRDGRSQFLHVQVPPPPNFKKRRGRPPKFGRPAPIVEDVDTPDEYFGGELQMDGSDEDPWDPALTVPEGEEKIDENGVLRDGNQLFLTSVENKLGREYAFNTFVLPDRHVSRLYCFSIDVAKLLHYRDSQHFFNLNPTVPRISTTLKEREMLVQKGLLQPKLKQRPVNIVAARSCFRRFGRRVIKNGRRGIDDYKKISVLDDDSDDERERQRIERMIEEDEKRRLVLPSFVMADKREELRAMMTFAPVEWVYQMAALSRQWNNKITELRKMVGGFWDANTGIWQVGLIKTPTRGKVTSMRNRREWISVTGESDTEENNSDADEEALYPVSSMVNQYQYGYTASDSMASIAGDVIVRNGSVYPGAVLNQPRPVSHYPAFSQNYAAPSAPQERHQSLRVKPYCGVIATSSGQPCRRPVHKQGDRCLYHLRELERRARLAAAAATSTTESPVPRRGRPVSNVHKVIFNMGRG